VLEDEGIKPLVVEEVSDGDADGESDEEHAEAKRAVSPDGDHLGLIELYMMIGGEVEMGSEATETAGREGIIP